MRRVLTAAMLAAAALQLAPVSGIARANGDGRSWHEESGSAIGFPIKTRSVLYYGVPQTDDMAIAFACDSDGKTIAVRSFIGTRGVSANQAARITLNAGMNPEVFAGNGIANEESGAVDIRASEPAVSALGKLSRLLQSKSNAMVIATPGVKVEVPLYGASAAYGQFTARCLSREKPKHRPE